MRGPIRARDLGVPLEGTPGPFNALTDVPGVEVGHVTIVRDPPEGAGGPGTARTGVTAVHPGGRSSRSPVYASWFRMNGAGELTGTAWIDESGLLEGPVVFTNTLAVGAAHTALVRWWLDAGNDPSSAFPLPVVGETWDGYLSDIASLPVEPVHVLAALTDARSGPLPEGNVGGGTGMVTFGYKGGIGTSSRKVEVGSASYLVGALVQANFGRRGQLTIAGRKLPPLPTPTAETSSEQGSVLVLIGTDAPLDAIDLARLARRAPLGLARTGSVAGDQSGDLVLAFATGLDPPPLRDVTHAPRPLGHRELDPLFSATVEATEEAVLNALVAAETMVGFRGHRVEALPPADVAALFAGPAGSRGG